MTDVSPRVIEGGGSDADRAYEIKKKVLEALAPVMVAIDEAKEQGFVVNFSLGTGPLGKQVVNQLRVAKEY